MRVEDNLRGFLLRLLFLYRKYSHRANRFALDSYIILVFFFKYKVKVTFQISLYNRTLTTIKNESFIELNYKLGVSYVLVK